MRTEGITKHILTNSLTGESQSQTVKYNTIHNYKTQFLPPHKGIIIFGDSNICKNLEEDVDFAKSIMLQARNRKAGKPDTKGAEMTTVQDSKGKNIKSS